MKTQTMKHAKAIEGARIPQDYDLSGMKRALATFPEGDSSGKAYDADVTALIAGIAEAEELNHSAKPSAASSVRQARQWIAEGNAVALRINKAAGKAKVSPKAQGDTPIKAKVESAPKAVFSLVAGAVSQVVHKGLRQAIAYHVSKGNLEKTDAGIKLTQQGQLLFSKERIEVDPAQFQTIAAFVHGGDVPAFWKGQPPTVNAMGTLQGKALQMPNVLYWGSFASTVMRQAFAALWSRKA